MKLSALLLGVAAAPVAALGSVKDDHGCIPSAGYSWCESSQKCVRPWEEGCEAVDEDDTAPVLGGDADNNSCIVSAGYNFCSELKTCVRYWEANADGVSYADLCPSMMKSLLAAADAGALRGRRRLSGVALGGVKDEHGCIPSAGYSWCESSQKCIRPWEEGCEDTAADAADADDADDADTAVLGADTDGTGCLASAGYAFCPELKTCVRYWEADGNGVSYADLCPTMMKAMQAEAADSDSNSNSSATAARRVLQLGGTKDENGCYVSAGYQWCETTSKCFRPWEEACAGVDVIADTTTAAVEVEDPPVVGGNKDENGCCTSCGFSWCDEMSVCVQPWLVDLAKQCPTLLKQLQAETYVNSR